MRCNFNEKNDVYYVDFSDEYADTRITNGTTILIDLGVCLLLSKSGEARFMDNDVKNSFLKAREELMENLYHPEEVHEAFLQN